MKTDEHSQRKPYTFISQSCIESCACFLGLLTAVNRKKQIVFVFLEDRLRLGGTTGRPEIE